ncbi:hypothetical protein ACQCN2_22390 [Brevibacillus ginsengisoli]|uniref:hypothetical protein n=1 Tax=Brevibacillus ginsengisoli TaxID=363854 RepID=UPI003CF3DE25
MIRLGFIAQSLILLILLLSGCSSHDQNSSATPKTQQTSATSSSSDQASEPDDGLINQLKEIAPQAKDARQIISALDTNMAHVNEKTADQMFLILEHYYEQYVPAVNDQLAKRLIQPGTAEKLNALEYPYDFTKIENDDALKLWMLSQVSSKLTLDNRDGDFYWRVDYDALNKAYSPYLSKDLKEYLSIQTVEANQNSMEDGGLTISRNELADRLLHTEHYLTTFPNGLKKVEMKTLYFNYLNQYIHEYRYEAIDENTLRLLPQVKQSYEKLVQEHPDTHTAQIVKDYLAIINANEDVIYEPGDPSISNIGNPKPNISEFWKGLSSKVDQLFTL